DFEGGTSHIETIIKKIPKLYEKKFKFRNNIPVIVILDNDSAGKKAYKAIYKCLIGSEENCQKQFFKYKNIYVTLLPSPFTDDKDVVIESYYNSNVLELEYNNKKFNPTNVNCTENEYGKMVFATKVIKENKSEINFERFIPLLDR